MAISRITAGASSTNSVTYSGSYAAGDIIVVQAINTSTSVLPTVPSGYTLVANVSDSTDSMAMSIFWILATSSSMTGITISNCTVASWAIYRGANTTTPFTNPSGQSGSGTSISYSGIATMTQSGGAGTSWVLVFSGANHSTSQLYNAIPTATSLIVLTSNYYVGPPAYEVDMFDTNTTASSYSFNNKTLAVTTPWFTKTAELNAASTAASPFPLPIRVIKQAVNRAGTF